GYIFPAKRSGVPYRGQTISHAIGFLFEARKKSAKHKPPLLAGSMERFTPHDLRRSVATRMRELGISRSDVKMVLNHRERDVTSRYDRYDGLPEKKRALDLWSNRLEQIVEGDASPSNIVDLARV